MLPRGSKSRLLLVAAALAGLSACGSDNDIFVRPLTMGDTVALTSGNNLISFNRTQPSLRRTSAAVTGVAAGESLIGVDFRPANGLLYGVDTAGGIYTINVSTGVATPVMNAGAPVVITGATLAGTAFGVDFNPVPDRLRIVSDTGQNLRVNVDTGATIVDGTLALNSVTATGVTAAAYTNSFGATCRTTLFYLDTAANTLLSTSAPNDGVLTTVGALGVTAAGSVSAFEISTSAAGANSAFAAIAGASGSALYTINTTTGAATAVGPIATAAGETVSGLAIAPPASAPVQTAGELFGLTESGRLVSFNRGAPTKLCTNTAVSGVGAGEDLVGVDFRPATGALYSLTADAANTGRLYTIDTATGAATAASTVSETLQGESFGVDFNPVPDRLRVVSDVGQNLRINVDTGATIVDGTLNGAATGASAAAYTNSVQAAGSTTLYVVDPSGATDMLYVQNPPNAGTLASPLTLNTGTDLSAVNGFDIDGRDNVALLAGSTAMATTSTLYTVNLADGTATALGAVGTGSGLAERLQGLARPTPTTTVFGLRNGTELVTLALSDADDVTSLGAITGLGSETLVGIDFRTLDGRLYGVGSGGGLFTIDPATAAASRVALVPNMGDPFVGLDGAAFGVDFNPAPAVVPLRIVSDEEQNLRVGTIATGVTSTDVALIRAADSFSISAAAYTNNVAPNPTSTVLYGLDAAGDRLVSITPPNNGVVRVIGPVGVDVTENAAFEIVGENTAIAILDATSVDKAVYSINLTSGAATLIGSTAGPADPIVGLSAPISATPAVDSPVFAVDSGNNLISFARNAPGTRIVDAGISGFVGGVGEAVVGIDFRTLDGLLWVLTNEAGTARLYTIDTSGVNAGTATVTATPVSTLGVATMGCAAGAPAYSGLSAGTFAVDFNPLPAAVPLRIISSTGQNLRVTNPATGTTCVDGSIGQPTPDVHAAAYTNSFRTPAGVTATTALFVMDAATGSLLQQGATNPPGPNGGVLTNVGALSAGTSFTTTSGFDIAGGANGVILAALQLSTESGSRLYRVDIATGRVTELSPGGLIGGAMGAPIGGIAIRIQ